MIPNEVVEAAAKALRDKYALEVCDLPVASFLGDARVALEAAVPHMLRGAKAEAWDECAGGYLDQLVSITLNWEELPNPYRSQA